MNISGALADAPEIETPTHRCKVGEQLRQTQKQTVSVRLKFAAGDSCCHKQYESMAHSVMCLATGQNRKSGGHGR
jgi:hypothetical protein